METLEDIWKRIKRFNEVLETKSHNGFNQSHLIDGSMQTYKVFGIKSPEQFEDELLSIIIWLWSIKDYIKNSYIKLNLNPKDVEKIVDKNFSLQLIADIANRAKHGTLNKSRSGKYAFLGEVGFSIPAASLNLLTFEPWTTSIKVIDTEKVVFTAKVKSQNGEFIANALEIIDSALKILEVEILKLTPPQNGIELALPLRHAEQRN